MLSTQRGSNNMTTILKLLCCRQHSSTMRFLERKYFVLISLKSFPYGYNWQKVSTGLDSGLAKHRLQAILLNSSSPGQNVRHFADDSFKLIFTNEKFCIVIWISPKFVPKGPLDNKSALILIVAWRQTCDKPLFEPMLTQFIDAYMRH